MDYRKLAEDELRAVRQLRAAEAICRDRLAELGDELRSFRTPSPQTDPVRGGGSKTEERWLSIIAAQQDEERRLRNVRRRLKRFNTAWAVISERDRTVLEMWYIEPGGDPVDRITRREGCGRATAFRWRDEALINLARAFFGTVVS